MKGMETTPVLAVARRQDPAVVVESKSGSRVEPSEISEQEELILFLGRTRRVGTYTTPRGQRAVPSKRMRQLGFRFKNGRWSNGNDEPGRILIKL